MDKNCCIYKIPCSVCNKFYIGQTSKSLFTRLKQHKYAVRIANENNALFVHVRDFNHNINWDSSTEIIFQTDFYKRNILESVLISNSFNNNMNLSFGLYNVDPVIQNFIAKHYNFSKLLD